MKESDAEKSRKEAPEEVTRPALFYNHPFFVAWSLTASIDCNSHSCVLNSEFELVRLLLIAKQIAGKYMYLSWFVG